MNSASGWNRAKLKLKGIDTEYNSLKEAYYLFALEKESRIEAKKTLALIKSNIAQSGESIEELNENVNDYLKELLPALEEQKEDFIGKGKEILDEFAGKEIIIGGD